MSFLKKLVKSAGSAVGGAVHIVTTPARLTAKAVGQIPVIGKPLSSVVNLANAPMKLADSIASGNRIDKAVIDNIKGQIKDVKTVGPYAQMILSVVPGVGTVAAGAIGAGIALANGQPIDDALIKGIKGALPGGPAVSAAFDMSKAVIDGKPLAQIGLSAIPLDDAQKKALTATLQFASDISKGKKITTIALERAQAALPPDIKKAVAAGLAIAQAQKTQKTIQSGVSSAVLNNFSRIGMVIIEKDPVKKAGYLLIKDPTQQVGYKVGVALMAHQVNPMEIVAIRNKLSGPQKAGFDLAAAAHVGATTTPAGASGIAPPVRSPATPASAQAAEAAAKAQFAFNASHGMVGTSDQLKNNVIKTVTSDSAATTGAKLAVAQIAAKKGGWWHKLLVHLGIAKDE